MVALKEEKNGGGEIDLVRLFQILWKGKWIILVVALIFGIVAAIYAYTSKPVYEASIAVLPPSLSNVAGFNQGRTKESGLQAFKVQDVYSVFLRNLQADETRHRFFENVYLPSLGGERPASRDSLYRVFNEKISITLPDKTQPSRYRLTVEQEDPELAAEWIRRYLADTAEHSVQEMVKNAHREIEVKARDVDQRIQTLRETAKLRREDRIVQLREALKVADAVGLEKPPMISGQVSEQLSAIMNGSLMYMRGSKALRGEIEALESRVSDDPFIPALRTLQEQEKLYSSLRVNTDEVAVFRQDGSVEMPDSPVKPKKLLLVMMGLLLGGAVGVVTVVFNSLYRNKR
ncbi:TPA: chain-length determining protein [Pseudomonas aeruginosa]|nr:chain-length determining protein [Pseudomonas aeruginosa]